MASSEWETGWYKWWPASYRAATMHLTPEQDGIYRRLIDHYMETRKPLPSNEIALARIAGTDHSGFCSAFAILLPFFRQDEAGLLHLNKCDEVLAEQNSISEKRRLSGKTGASKRHGKYEGSGNCQAKAEQKASRIEKIREEKKEEEEEQRVGEASPGDGGDKYAFSGLVIKLSRPDFDAWAKTYSAIPDLSAELKTIEQWLITNGKERGWFVSVAGMLNRKHQDIIASKKPVPGKIGNGGSMRELRKLHQSRAGE